MIKGVSPRQEILADQIIFEASVEPGKRRGKVALVEAGGYATAQARHKSGEIIQSDGVKKALAEKGFSEEAAKKVVAEIMGSSKTKPETRLKATDQVFRVFGSYKESASGPNVNISNFENLAILLSGKQNGNLEDTPIQS